MSTRKYASGEEALKVAKEAMWLAYGAAGGPFGMGFMQVKADAAKEEVWSRAFNMGDYAGRGGMPPSEVNGDYVFGRMLKLRFSIKGDSLEIPDHEPRNDYQAWCDDYPTYAALFDAAEKSSK